MPFCYSSQPPMLWSPRNIASTLLLSVRWRLPLSVSYLSDLFFYTCLSLIQPLWPAGRSVHAPGPLALPTLCTGMLLSREPHRLTTETCWRACFLCLLSRRPSLIPLNLSHPFTYVPISSPAFPFFTSLWSQLEHHLFLFIHLRSGSQILIYGPWEQNNLSVFIVCWIFGAWKN